MIGPSRMSLATFGVGLATATQVVTFGGPRERFWTRITMSSLALGGYALATSRSARGTRIGRREIALGLACAVGMAASSRAGERLLRRVVPTAQRDLREISQLRRSEPAPIVGARLLLVVAPAEELFWRGLVVEALIGRYGRLAGAILGAAAYGGAHLATGNATLVAAAVAAGGAWSMLRALGLPMGALVVCHGAWDVWVFLVGPRLSRDHQQAGDGPDPVRTRRVPVVPVAASAGT
jgi:hypothetical protein